MEECSKQWEIASCEGPGQDRAWHSCGMGGTRAKEQREEETGCVPGALWTPVRSGRLGGKGVSILSCEQWALTEGY